jgi:hypothetical protein
MDVARTSSRNLTLSYRERAASLICRRGFDPDLAELRSPHDLKQPWRDIAQYSAAPLETVKYASYPVAHPLEQSTIYAVCAQRKMRGFRSGAPNTFG